MLCDPGFAANVFNVPESMSSSMDRTVNIEPMIEPISTEQSVLISNSCWRFPSFKAGWCSGNTLLENCRDGSCLDARLCADCLSGQRYLPV
ncbi:hypothetical protein CesoFtcFv8_008376 [Champsocephalus esox]|uniref:Uncharacterized protein n=1 Tax=Champsocephalus esox TaxID=159716 RepID=A0AAN8H1W0_9TELE|nr:hypothetical protein CesoFtcFv8_008376 [Champsocephalus esox]